ncbi:MAG: ABC transporter permease [Clostridiales bacterium]|nr:ABC transporter permease [Clostridiales bacterium]
MNKLKKLFVRWESFLVLIIFLEFVVFGTLNSKFLNITRLFNSLNQFLPICIISLAVTFVMITGGMDIQAGSIVGLTSIVVGVLWNDAGLNIFAACAVALIAGGLCGALSGFFVAFTGVQPMVVTLGGSFLYSGLALAVTNMSATEAYQGISNFPEAFRAISKTKVFGVVPMQFVIFLVLVVITYILLHKTNYGRKVFLCGVNQNAAEFSGINSRLIIMSTYVLSGVAASIAGILLTAYLGTAKADLGAEYTLPIITAVVLGGTSNSGGSGGVIGSALAALAIGLLRIGLNLNGLATQYLDIPVGVLLVLVVSFRFAGTNPKLRKFFMKKKKPETVSKVEKVD